MNRLFHASLIGFLLLTAHPWATAANTDEQKQSYRSISVPLWGYSSAVTWQRQQSKQRANVTLLNIVYDNVDGFSDTPEDYPQGYYYSNDLNDSQSLNLYLVSGIKTFFSDKTIRPYSEILAGIEYTYLYRRYVDDYYDDVSQSYQLYFATHNEHHLGLVTLWRIGAEYFISEQFSLAGHVGLSLRYTGINLSDEKLSDRLRLGTFNGVMLNWYW
ncbi:MAG: hypothetical protein OEY38_06035 [Gammaproteobacteria bacterium]|nr:hypothetical protein [Gammaproteobacteria bacterium]